MQEMICACRTQMHRLKSNTSLRFNLSHQLLRSEYLENFKTLASDIYTTHDLAALGQRLVHGIMIMRQLLGNKKGWPRLISYLLH